MDKNAAKNILKNSYSVRTTFGVWWMIHCEKKIHRAKERMKYERYKEWCEEIQKNASRSNEEA